MWIGPKHFPSFCLGALLSGCFYPGPSFERTSDSAITIENQAILHAYYELSDPIGIIPSSASWAVTEVDGEQWTQDMLGQWAIVSPSIKDYTGYAWKRIMRSTHFLRFTLVSNLQPQRDMNMNSCQGLAALSLYKAMTYNVE